MANPPTRTPQEINAEIISRLDLLAELKALGVETVGSVRQSGIISCRAIGRPDHKPSAFFNTKTGVWGDSGSQDSAAYTCSLFDLAARLGKFSDWQEARKAFAQKAGVTIGREKVGESKDWRNRLELEPWSTTGNDIIALRWCLHHKKGVTVEAIKAAGGTLGYYPCYFDKQTKQRVRAKSAKQVVAIPAYGQFGLAVDPVAWIVWHTDGSNFDVTPKDHPKDQPRITTKMLSVGLTAGTLAGLSALMILSDTETRQAVEWVWKVEGPADMLALWSAIPCEQRGRHLVITNCGGATSDVLPHQAKILAGLKVAVCGDADEAGVVGAEKWCRALDGLTTETRNVRLGWATEKKHGRDVRDFLIGVPLPGEAEPPPGTETIPRPYSTILAIAEATQPWQKPVDVQEGQSQSLPPQPAGSPGGDADSQSAAPTATADTPSTRDIDTFTDRQIADALQIDVLGRTEDGKIEVYSEFLTRTVAVGNVAKLKYNDLELAFGTPVRKVVLQSNQDSVPGMYPIGDVRSALAHLASFRMLGDESKLGLGIWPYCDRSIDCDETGDVNAVVMVNSTEAAHFNGTVQKIAHPRHHDSLLEFDTSVRPWYNFDQISSLLKQAEDQAFRNTIVDDLVNLFGRWRWRSGHDPIIVTGLVLATWVQSLWAWRPRIDILGASNTGKSMLCAALAGLFDRLVILTSDTTAAGLRQKIANRMLAVIVDEVDAKNKGKLARQREILEMIRSASRGTASIRGSGTQKAVEFTLRHLVWVAGITLSYDDAADRNRAIMLNLLPPLPEMAGKLTLPTHSELGDIGRRSLAASLWAIRAARVLAVKLKDTRIPGADPRIVESYAVPAAMLSIVGGYDNDVAVQFLTEMLCDAKSDAPVESDEANLIAEILQAHVMLERHKLTVGQAIKHVLDLTTSNRDEWRLVLEGVGIRVGVSELVMNYGAVRSKLLRGTRWEGQPIDQTLRRVAGCKSSQQSIGGVKSRGVRFPLSDFVRDWVGVSEQDDPQKGF